MSPPNWKPAKGSHKRAKAAADRKHAADRRACCDVVWARAGPFCELCRAFVHRAHTFYKLVGHVDERIPKSQGGSDTDPDNCRLLCFACHFSGPSGAHRKTVRDATTDPNPGR